MHYRSLFFMLALTVSAAGHAATTPAPVMATDSARLTNDATLPSDASESPNVTTTNPVAPLVAADHQAVEEAMRQLEADKKPPALPMRINASKEALDQAKKKLQRDQKACQLVATQNNSSPVNAPECR